MSITKKDQILQLHKDGYKIEDIVNRGFSKKYVAQVLRNATTPASPTTTNNKTSINEIQQMISLLECLKSKSSELDMEINISIKINNKNTKTKNTTSKKINSHDQTPLLNPVTAIREIGDIGLREKLLLLDAKDLISIIKAYVPDINRKIYKEKNINLIIDYIIERSSSLSKVGQVFRDMGQPKK